MVHKLSEDSAPHITASEVMWNQYQGKALFEIKTVQRDSGISGWGISGYIVFGPGNDYLGLPSDQGHKVDHKELWRQNQDLLHQ